MTPSAKSIDAWHPTALDIERFTEGDCHYLARALHRRTGWSMAAFSCGGEPDLHAFVLTPDGRVLDVQGACTKHVMRTRWGGKGIRAYEWRALSAFGPPDYGEASVARARVVARNLLEGLEA